MCPHALIPFKPAGPKSQLSGILSPEEREAFARAMLEDVIAAAKDANCSPVIIATDSSTARTSRSRSPTRT